MEDDLALSPAIASLTPDLIETIDSLDWDFLYFGHELTGPIDRAGRGSSKISFWPCAELQTAHFYAVKKRIIPRLIAHLERNASTVPGDQYFGPMPVDGAYNTFRRYNHDVKSYIAVPKLGWQRPSRSDLSPRNLDGIGFARPFLSLARNIKHALDRARSG